MVPHAHLLQTTTTLSVRVQLQVLYRLTNDMHCNLGAVAEFDDSDPDNVVGKFKYYGAIPGLGTAHASVVYDDVSDLFFMVSNLGRNSLQPWDTEMHGPQCAALLLPPARVPRSRAVPSSLLKTYAMRCQRTPAVHKR